MPSPWEWSEASHRYRNVVTGRFMGAKEMLTYRDAFVASQKEVMVALTERVAAGDMGMLAWQREMRNVLRTSFTDLYALGIGGRGNMTPSDWGKIGAMMQGQEKYLRGFAADIYMGNLSLAQAKARAAMYGGAGTAAFERGKAASFGMPELPDYPGSGNTPCKSNCQCSWEITEVEDGFDAVWALGAAEHCDGCLENAANWNPLHIDKPAD